MKIVFNGLGPKDTVTIGGKLYRNGSVVNDVPAESAVAFINAHLAMEVRTETDEDEVKMLQNLETKNAARRRTVKEKADAVLGEGSAPNEGAGGN